MEAQLRLLTAPEPRSPVEGAARGEADEPVDPAPPLEGGADSWRLSDRTRSLGRAGIERARAALRASRASAGDDHASANHPSAA
jgi:hypothetical protein